MTGAWSVFVDSRGNQRLLALKADWGGDCKFTWAKALAETTWSPSIWTKILP